MSNSSKILHCACPEIIIDPDLFTIKIFVGGAGVADGVGG